MSEPAGPAGVSNEDALARAFALLGVLGLAALGLLASTLLSGARRSASGEPAGAAAAEQAAVILEERTRRRGHVRLPEDPIVAAMGVGPAAQRTPRQRRRAKPVGSVPRDRDGKRPS
jgi:hypothetical protein